MEIRNWENGIMEGFFKGYTFTHESITMGTSRITTQDENGNKKNLPSKIEEELRKEINEYIIGE